MDLGVRGVLPYTAEVMAERGEVQAVIAGFTAAWAHPELERFMALLHPQVRLRAAGH